MENFIEHIEGTIAELKANEEVLNRLLEKNGIVYTPKDYSHMPKEQFYVEFREDMEVIRERLNAMMTRYESVDV